MTGAQPVKGAVRLLRVVDGVTRTAYGSRVQLTGVTRHICTFSHKIVEAAVSVGGLGGSGYPMALLATPMTFCIMDY